MTAKSWGHHKHILWHNWIASSVFSFTPQNLGTITITIFVLQKPWATNMYSTSVKIQPLGSVCSCNVQTWHCFGLNKCWLVHLTKQPLALLPVLHHASLAKLCVCSNHVCCFAEDWHTFNVKDKNMMRRKHSNMMRRNCPDSHSTPNHSTEHSEAGPNPTQLSSSQQPDCYSL